MIDDKLLDLHRFLVQTLCRNGAGVERDRGGRFVVDAAPQQDSEREKRYAEIAEAQKRIYFPESYRPAK